MKADDDYRGYRERPKDIGQGKVVEMSRLTLFFKGRAVQKINAERVYGIREDAPSLAYVSLQTLRLLRDRSINRRDAPCEGYQNEPVLRMRKLKRRLIEPKTRWEDVYIYITMIALLQERRRLQGYREDCVRVHVVVLPDILARQLNFYTGIFPAEFLDRFDEPSRASPWREMEIRYTSMDLESGIDSSVAQFNETITTHNVKVTP